MILQKNEPNIAQIKRLICENKWNISVKILTWGKKNSLWGFLDTWILKIKVSATREKGKANEAVINFLSKQLSIPPKNIHIVSWEFQEYKVLHIKL